MCPQLIKNGAIAVLLGVFAIANRNAAASDAWPQFRGPNGSGVALKAKPPEQISPTNSVLWRIAVPWSPSSPCLWDQRIFLTTFADNQLQTLCYSRREGRLLWARGIQPPQLEAFHPTDGSPAASTPATDGRSVVSYFGSFGAVCYDFDGKELWRHPLPLAISAGNYGSGTSPVIAAKRVLLNRDQDGNSSVLALDLRTGKTAWETARPDASGSFGTPIVWKDDGNDEVVLSGALRLKAYDLKTGRERWLVDGLAGFACTTPIAGDGLLFFAQWNPGGSDAPWPSWEVFLQQYDKNHDGEITFDEFSPGMRDFARGLDRDHDGKITKKDWDIVQAGTAKAHNLLVAVKSGGHGDITQTHVAWKVTRGLPYVPSPLLYDGRIYMIRDGGMLTSVNAKTGEPFYTQERLEAPGSYYASPVAANGRIYVSSLAGKLTVVKAGGEKPEVLHQVDFGDRIFATPALLGPNVYLRTQTNLYAFGK
jgi:outer membrane protein assembly factor BamB